MNIFEVIDIFDVVYTTRSVNRFDVVVYRFDVFDILTLLYRFEVLNRFELLITFELVSRFELLNILNISTTAMFEVFAIFMLDVRTIFDESKIFEDWLNIFDV